MGTRFGHLAMVERDDLPEIQIETDIPLPKRRGYARKFPFDKMEVGNSIPLPDKETYLKATSASQHYGKEHGKKFASRSTPDGFRIWRIA